MKTEDISLSESTVATIEKETAPPEQQLFAGDYAHLLNEAYPDVKVDGELLSFASIDDFLRASMMISKRTTPEIIAWNDGLSFQSLYREYSNVMDRFEQLEITKPEAPDFLTSEEAERYTVELIDEAFMVKRNFTSRGMASLVNTDNLVLIADNLHHFTDEAHIVVIGRDYEKMQQAIASGSGEEENGVFYTRQQREDRSKTQTKFQNCPNPYGIAHRETIGDQRLVLEMFMYFVGGPSGPGLISPEWTVEAHLYNYRKKFWSWQRTWTDLQIDLIATLGARVEWAPYLNPGQTPPVPGGYISTTTTPPRICGQWIDRSEVSVIVHLITDGVDYDDANFDWAARIFMTTGRVQGYRTSNQTSPPLDITVGCN